MKRWLLCLITIAALLQVVGSGISAAEGKVFVTAKELIASNHRIEVGAGTEIVWNDPHVDRVWFPPNSGIRVQRTDTGGLSAVFSRPGRYEGRLTMTAAMGAGAFDVMPLTVIVRDPQR